MSDEEPKEQLIPIHVMDGIYMLVPMTNFADFWKKLTTKIDNGKATTSDLHRYAELLIYFKDNNHI